MEDTPLTIHQAGHRRFVGGTADTWDPLGDLQFRFLLEHGLSPSDILIDVGCGALRGGAKFIHYLEPDHYLGVDKHIELIVYGVAAELGLDAYREKRPRFLVSDTFEFQKLEVKPGFGIAQSLFTHLSAPDLQTCLLKLRSAGAPGCRLFATFFEVSEPQINPPLSNSHGYFAYTRSAMENFGSQAGWESHYIGEWNHPRLQNMIEYVAR